MNHILLSYQKHHSPAQQPISEDKVNDDQLECVKPLNGIESNKFQPLIRKVEKANVLISPADFSPAYKITRHLLKSYKNSLMNYVSGESREQSAKREASATSQKKTRHTHSNAMAVEEYNNLGEMRNSYSVATNYDSKPKSLIDNILINKNAVIEILSNKGTNEEKQILLKKIIEEFEPANKNFSEEPRSLKGNHVSSSGMIEHTKSMGIEDESQDSLLCEDDAPNSNLKEKMANHSFHKRPLSQSNMLRSKSSRQKKRKKTPVHNIKPQNSLISNTDNVRALNGVPETEQIRTKKLIDDSKFGNKAIVNASNRPKSSRGNRSFDS